MPRLTGRRAGLCAAVAAATLLTAGFGAALLTGAQATPEAVVAAPAARTSAQPETAPSAPLAIAPSRENDATRVLLAVLPDEAEAAELGLRIVPNVFDNRVPPSAEALFRSPLPGQTPASPILSEFIQAGFVLGRAQSYERADGRRGKLGAVAWAFETEGGARRAFRALRDLSGQPSDADPFAEVALRYEDRGLGLSELLWVQGPLLVRVGYAVPDENLEPARQVRDRLARLVAKRAEAAADAPIAATQAPDGAPVEGLRGRLGALRISERELPAGLGTVEPPLGGDGVFLEPTGFGGPGPGPLDAASAAGYLGGVTQGVQIPARRGTYLGLSARAFRTPAAARGALERRLASRARTAAVSDVVPGGRLVEGAGREVVSELWWVRGELLLQVGAWWRPGAPVPTDARDALARLLDERAARF